MSTRSVRTEEPPVWRHPQRGSLLVEFMLVAALALAFAIWGSHEWAQRLRVLQAGNLASWMQTAQDAVRAYLLRSQSESGAAEFPPLTLDASGDWVPGPSWESLQAAGLLPAGWQSAGPLGQHLVIRMRRSVDCTPPACALQALVHTQSPLLDRRGRMDQALIAEWLLAAQGRGFVFWGHEPMTFSGAGQRITVSGDTQEPLAGGMVALLAEVAGLMAKGGTGGDQEAGDTSAFLRVRDARDPDFQNDVSAQGVVRSASRLAARESVVLEDGWQPGAACSPDGALAREQAYPGVLVCRQGTWRLVARASGGGYMLNSMRGCRNVYGSPTHNPYTGGCSCSAGFTEVQVSESGSIAMPDGATAGYLCVPR